MKTVINKIGLIAVVLMLFVFSFNSCTKNNKTNLISESSLISKDAEVILNQQEYQNKLIDLYIEFWSNLSSNPISEIEKACDERDYAKLIQLANYSDEEILEFMNNVILYSSPIVHKQDASDCNCDSDIQFENIVHFVKDIQQNGGAEVFFHQTENTD